MSDGIGLVCHVLCINIQNRWISLWLATTSVAFAIHRPCWMLFWWRRGWTGPDPFSPPPDVFSFGRFLLDLLHVPDSPSFVHAADGIKSTHAHIFLAAALRVKETLSGESARMWSSLLDSDSFLFWFSGAGGRQQQPVCGMANSIQVEPTTESKVACVIAGFLFSLSPSPFIHCKGEENLTWLPCWCLALAPFRRCTSAIASKSKNISAGIGSYRLAVRRCRHWEPDRHGQSALNKQKRHLQGRNIGRPIPADGGSDAAKWPFNGKQRPTATSASRIWSVPAANLGGLGRWTTKWTGQRDTAGRTNGRRNGPGCIQIKRTAAESNFGQTNKLFRQQATLPWRRCHTNNSVHTRCGWWPSLFERCDRPLANNARSNWPLPWSLRLVFGFNKQAIGFITGCRLHCHLKAACCSCNQTEQLIKVHQPGPALN